MKKILTCVLTLCPMVASADYLDDKLANLITEKQNLISQLEECQKAKGGLMVAGITTLGVSAIGIGANIGEAVALKDYDAKINTAVQTKSDLDVQIIDAQRKKAEEEAARLAAQSGVNLVYQPVMPGVDVNNTCGIQTCSPDTPTQAMLDILNAKTAVCKDGVWVAQSCKDNFTGIQKSCTLNGQLVLYIEACNSNGVQPEQKTCSDITPAWLSERNAKTGACDTTTGENYITECADNSFNGVPRTTGNKQGYEKCEKSGRKHHEDCTAEETAKIPNAATSWWDNGKCVAKSCKPGTYLRVKNGISQGDCMTECPDWQAMAGSVALCDVSKRNPADPNPFGPKRKHHEDCTAEETAKIPNAATSWWYNGKCVAKSCKPYTFLHVKNGESQGQCMTACPAWQITDWKNGGQACDVAKQKPADPAPVQATCARVNQIAVNDSGCKSQCAKFATDNKCFWNQEYLWKNNICICSPTDADRLEANRQVIENFVPNVPVQKNNCPEGFADIKGVTVYYGYQYMPYAPKMNVGIKVDGFFYRCGVVDGVDSKTMSDAEWRKRKAEELALAKLKEMKYCNYKLEYSSDAVYK